MINSRLLKAQILKSDFSHPEIAQKMGISLYSLQKKINNKSEFKQSEIQKITEIIGMENAIGIFLTLKMNYIHLNCSKKINRA